MTELSAPTTLRKDAEHNRLRLLTAAREVFAEEGLDATMTSVAQRAGVGVGTLYRRFPTRDALLAALFEEEHQEYEQALQDALNQKDAWKALYTYLERLCAHQARNGGLKEALTLAMPISREVASQRDQLRVGMQTLIERAQKQGILRPDVTPEDLYVVLLSNAGIIAATAKVNPRVWRRALAFMLDGFRVQGAHPLPVASLSAREVLRIQRRRFWN